MIHHPLNAYSAGINIPHNEDQASIHPDYLAPSPYNNAMDPISFENNVASPCTESPQSISCRSSRNSSGVFSSSSTYNDCPLINCNGQSKCLNDSLDSFVSPMAESCSEIETQAILYKKSRQLSDSIVLDSLPDKRGEVWTRQRPGLSRTISSLRLLTDHGLVDENEQATDGLFCRLQVKNESISPQDSISFILAQIERQNTLLEGDPKSICIQSNQLRAHFSTVQRLVTDNLGPSSTTSTGFPLINTTEPSSIPTAPEKDDQTNEEIDWDLWEAIIQDFDRVATRLPHILAVKLKAGIPTKVRGLIWQAMCKSGSLYLETVYGQLCSEKSPQERIIKRDLARTFPRIEMFKQEDGPGQISMRRILEAYSLYDADVGYCQGLAFLVGPLLMNMEEEKAFCVFVRLMETYEMRTMFTHNMEGLQLRLYQFSSLLSELLPKVAAHMDTHSVHAAMYASQWFLTLFAYAFPMDLVTRIYDIVFAEGAAETIMRIAIAMLKRSQENILAEDEFENLLDIVTSRKLCKPYGEDFCAVIQDAMSLSGAITREKLDVLTKKYNQGDQNRKIPNQALAKRTGFWRRLSIKPPPKNSDKHPPPLNMQRSTSTNSYIKKRWTSHGKESGPGITSSITMSSISRKSDDEYMGDRKMRMSFSSLRKFSSTDTIPTVDSLSDLPRPNILGVPSKVAACTFDHSTLPDSSSYAKLEHAFEQLSREHKSTLEAMMELKMDKQDVESERDALKMTMIEMERRYNSSQSKKTSDRDTESADSHTSLSPSFLSNPLQIKINDGNMSQLGSITLGDGESTSTISYLNDEDTFSYEPQDHSSIRPESICYSPVSSCWKIPMNEISNKQNAFQVDCLDENEAVRKELVRIKVENFELNQQVEKVTHELEDVQSKLEMVNESQIALMERLITLQCDMDSLKDEKFATEYKLQAATQENASLRVHISYLLFDNRTQSLSHNPDDSFDIHPAKINSKDKTGFYQTHPLSSQSVPFDGYSDSQDMGQGEDMKNNFFLGSLQAYELTLEDTRAKCLSQDIPTSVAEIKPRRMTTSPSLPVQAQIQPTSEPDFSKRKSLSSMCLNASMNPDENDSATTKEQLMNSRKTSTSLSVYGKLWNAINPRHS
ncbi:rab-GTPase-TBC domain-containing protein [Phycomyces nitens]|nr:rab-GTPase-TBC domain-containing protein [Phycomyces nitens]